MPQAMQTAADLARHPLIALLLGVLAALAVKLAALDTWGEWPALIAPKAVSDWISIVAGMLPPLFAQWDREPRT